MTFEEQLTRAFETLTERLRGDLDREVQRASADLAAAARSDRERAASDVQSTAEEMEIAAASQQEAHEKGFAAGREEGRRDEADASARQVVQTGDGERLASAVRAIERARSLTEILDALVSGARTEAAGAGVWLIRGGRLHPWRSTGADAADADPLPDRSFDEGGVIADAARTNAIASARGTLAVPIALAGSAVAVLYADLRAERGTESVERSAQNVELLTRFAARSLEALTAFKTARALTHQSGGPDVAGPSLPASEDANAEEDVSARRFARLLVSEIKLYHESAVIDGRRDRDLATRLGGEIARARAMYEQRVPPHVRLRADHFHDELVRTLANGDSSLLELKTQN